MLKIRLQRVGRKNDPSFRIVVTDSHNGPKSGRFLEILGSHNARFGKPQIKGDRVKHWISQGAQVSDTVHNLLVNEKVIEGKKVNVLPKKSPIKKEEDPNPTDEQGEKPEEAPKKDPNPAKQDGQEKASAETAPETEVEEKSEKESEPTEEDKKEPETKEDTKTEEDPNPAKQDG